MAIEPSPPSKYSSSMFCACSTTARPLAPRFSLWPEQVRRLLFIAAGALQRTFDDELLDVFERHVRRHVPLHRRGGGARTAVIKRQVDRLDLLVFRQQHCAFNYILKLAHVAGPRMREQALV